MAPDGRVEKEPGDSLRPIAFEAGPAIVDRKVCKWRLSGEAMAKLLTPSFGEKGIKLLPALGVSAPTLGYLNFRMVHPTQPLALWRARADPAPNALRTTVRRRHGGPQEVKVRKDRARAGFIIRILV